MRSDISTMKNGDFPRTSMKELLKYGKSLTNYLLRSDLVLLVRREQLRASFSGIEDGNIL